MLSSHTTYSKRAVIVVAGGSGQRMQQQLPKQFLPLQGKPVLMHTLNRLHQFDAAMQFIVVLPQAHHQLWQQLCQQQHFVIPHLITNGGATRFHSVKQGLQHLQETVQWVAVHDGVRPFASHETLSRCFQLAETSGAAIPVVAPVETIRKLSEGQSHTVNREEYRLVQTPQVFEKQLLLRAYEQPYEPRFTDDASVVEGYGHRVHLTEGNPENIKITTPFDWQLAEHLLQINS